MVTACSALSDGNVTPCLMACSPLISVFMGTLWLLSVCATRYCNHITVTSTLLLALQKFFSDQHGRQKKLKTKQSFYSHGNQLMEENGGVVRITRRVLGKCRLTETSALCCQHLHKQRIPSDVKAECMQTPARQPEPLVSHVLSPRLWAGFHLSARVCATVGSGLYC